MASTTDNSLPTIDGAASLGDKTVQAIIKAGETATESAIIAAEPVMATPILKQIWEGALDWVFGIFSSALGTFTGYVIIDIQKYEALNNAAKALATLKAAQASGDSDAITKANADMDVAIAPVLHFIGIVKP